jgi:methionine-rich copper-binding protein CopC
VARCLFVLLLFVAVAADATAHAVLERAEPRPASKVRTMPAEVKLWFTESLEPTFSTVRVVDAQDRRVDREDVRVDAANPALLRVSLPPLPAGTYRVIWRVVSVDTHVSQGQFTFSYAP